MLHQLITEQIEEGEELPAAAKSGEALFELFEESRRFRQLYAEAINRFLVSFEGKRLDGIRKDFIGGLFQAIAYTFLAGQQTDSALVLSPERTFELYTWLFPNSTIVHHPFGTKSIYGVSVPDGLLVKATEGVERVIALCEYTQGKYGNKLENKYRGMRKDVERFRSIFPYTRILFLTPQEVEFPAGIRSAPLAKVLEVPFKPSQFRRYVDRLLNLYRPYDDSATLRDIVAWGQERAIRRLYI